MTSIGGRPILKQACKSFFQPNRGIRLFSTAPAATTNVISTVLTSHSAIAPETDAVASRRSDTPCESANSYGQWVSMNAGVATRKQRVEALKKFYDSSAEHKTKLKSRPSNTMYDHALLIRKLSEGAAENGIAAQNSAARRGRTNADGYDERLKNIRQFLDHSRRQLSPSAVAQRLDTNQRVVSNSDLRRQGSFGLYASGSTVEQLGTKLPGWAVSTAGTKPVFSAGRWMHECSAAERHSKSARRAALKQFLISHD